MNDKLDNNKCINYPNNDFNLSNLFKNSKSNSNAINQKKIFSKDLENNLNANNNKKFKSNSNDINKFIKDKIFNVKAMQNTDNMFHFKEKKIDEYNVALESKESENYNRKETESITDSNLTNFSNVI